MAHDSGICLQSDKDYDADSEIIDSQGQTKRRLVRKGRKSRNQEMQSTKQSSISLQTNETTDLTEQSIDQSLTVDQEQAEQTDSRTIHLNQASNTSTNDSSPLESETSQSSFLEDEVKKVELFTLFDFSQEKTKELQRLDTQLHGLINYLETNILPKSQKKARRILLETGDYALIDGLLWHSRAAKSKHTQHLDHYQLVFPATMIKSIIQLYHDSPMSGHSGITDTLSERALFLCTHGPNNHRL